MLCGLNYAKFLSVVHGHSLIELYQLGEELIVGVADDCGALLPVFILHCDVSTGANRGVGSWHGAIHTAKASRIDNLGHDTTHAIPGRALDNLLAV